MHLVQILLPTHDNEGRPFATALFGDVRAELIDAFGGVTAFTRAPASGIWDEGSEVVHDDIVIFEAMAETLDAGWWRVYRRSLEERFRQDEIVIRALPMDRI